MHPRIILAIAKKDILDAIRNAYVLFALILPLGMSLLFSFMTPGGGEDRALDIVVYDAGQSHLIDQLEANAAVKLTPVESADEVPIRIKKGPLGGFALPANFDAAVSAGETPELRVYYNGRRTIVEQTALKQALEEALRAIAGQNMPATLIPFDVNNTGREVEFELPKFYLTLLLVLSLCMAGVFVVPTMLVEEKEKHTDQAILVSPADHSDLVIGKALAGMFYSLLMALLLLLLNNGFTGNATVTVLAVALGSLFLVLTGLLLGALFSTTAQVNSWGSIVLLALLIPTIFILPPQPPAPVSTIVHLFPTSYMADAIIGGLSGKVLPADVILDFGVLAVATAAVCTAAIWALRRGRR
jgi:ABC-2 type transport system permease protein